MATPSFAKPGQSNCIASLAALTEPHFTGKFRDAGSAATPFAVPRFQQPGIWGTCLIYDQEQVILLTLLNSIRYKKAAKCSTMFIPLAGRYSDLAHDA
jgi:hypothetical protein